MKHLMILAAAAFLAVGCHNRSEDETGAAPDKGSPSVTATDSASLGTDSTTGAVPNSSATTADTASASVKASVSADSTGAPAAAASDSASWTTDTTSAAPADSTAR